jgi:hypothetical protein
LAASLSTANDSADPRWQRIVNHPWFVQVVGGLAVTGLIALFALAL